MNLAENSEDFKVLLGTTFDVNKIKSQLNNIKGLTVKVGVDTSGIKQSIQKAIQEASKGASNINIGANTSNRAGSSGASNTAAQIERINNALNTGVYSVKLAQLQSGFQKVGLTTQEVETKMARVRSAYNALLSASPDNLIIAQKRFNTVLATTQNELTIAKIQAGEYISVLQQVKLSNKIQTWLNNNTAATKEAKLEMQSYLTMLSSGNSITPVQYKEINAAVDNLTTSMRTMGRLGNSPIHALKAGMSKFTGWIGASALVMRAINEVRNGIKTIEELDDGLTNINYTMEVTSSQLKDIGNSSVKMAKDLHTSTSNVLSAVKLYANANETASSILEKAKPATMLSNITGNSGETEAKNLQAMQNQFQLLDDELMDLTDTIENISANMSYDFADGIAQITEGIQLSGAAAKAAGMNYKRYMSLLGAGIENTGLSGSQLANAYKTMMARTTSASKASIANGEVTEDDISNAEKSLRAVNIEVRKTNDSFYEFDQTMGAIYEKLDELSEVELSKLAYDVAGVRQSSIFRSMIQSYGTYLKLAEEAENSQGKALEVQEKYAESIKGHLGELKSTGESIWNNILNSGELKAGVTTLTTILKLLDGITGLLKGLGTIGLGVGIFAGAQNVGR